MKITIEKDQYDFETSAFKTTLVFDTNEVSFFEASQMVNKALGIIAINGKYDWRDKLFDGFHPTPIDKAAPVIYSVPAPSPNTIPNFPNWTPMQPLIGDPTGWPNTPSVICSGSTSEATDRATVTSTVRPMAMTQADGMGDDSGTRGD